MSHYYDDYYVSPYEEGWEDGYYGWDVDNPFYYGSQAYYDWEWGYMDGESYYFAIVFRHYGY